MDTGDGARRLVALVTCGESLGDRGRGVVLCCIIIYVFQIDLHLICFALNCFDAMKIKS